MEGTDERGSDAAGDTGRTRVMRVVCAVAACVLWLAAPAHAGPVNGDGEGPTARTSIAGGYYPRADFALYTTSLVDPTRTATNGDFGRQFCTGVLIAPQRVLTAAHCVVGSDNRTPRPASKFQVLVGRRDLTLTTQGERRNVTGVAVHPKVYLPHIGVHTNHAFYDIAVLFLDRPVTTVAPVPIGTPDDWNAAGTVLGFGHYNYDHDHPLYDQYLRAADFDMWGDNRCAQAFLDPTSPGVQHFYGAIHVCANNAPNSATVDCITHGDSGGPLLIWDQQEARWKLIGITSFYPRISDRCGAGGPFGFAWVAGAEMRNWPMTVAHPPITGGGGGTGIQPVNTYLSRSWLPSYVKSLIREHTNGKIRKLRRSCSRFSSSSFNCRLSFRVKRQRYKGIAAIWVYAENGKAYWTYAFTGKRTRIGRHRSRHVKW